MKKFHVAKPLAFSLHFVFRRDQNHYTNLNSKIMKMCEQIIKKKAPQYNSNSLNCKKKMIENQYSSSSRKKTTRTPITASAIALRLLKMIMIILQGNSTNRSCMFAEVDKRISGCLRGTVDGIDES